MIRRDWQGDWFLIPQPEHARLSGFLAGHWGADGFPRAQPWEDLVFAAAEHDNGWIEWDRRPSLNAEGAPAFMYENPIREVFAISHRGIQRLYDQARPYAAALVSRHYVNWAADILTGVRKIRPVTPELRAEIEAYRKAEEKRQADILRELGGRPEFGGVATREGIHRNGRFVWTFDMISLIPCCRWPHIETLQEVPVAGGYDGLGVKLAGEDTLRVKPWPFDADSLEFAVRGRRLPRKPFRDLAEFWKRFEETPESEVVFRYSPG